MHWTRRAYCANNLYFFAFFYQHCCKLLLSTVSLKFPSNIYKVCTDFNMKRFIKVLFDFLVPPITSSTTIVDMCSRIHMKSAVRPPTGHSVIAKRLYLTRLSLFVVSAGHHLGYELVPIKLAIYVYTTPIVVEYKKWKLWEPFIETVCHRTRGI